jgi:hypothetical protein
MSDSLPPRGTPASPELVEELRSFLDNLKERTPQEAIGIEESSSLVSSLVISTIGFVALVGLLTTIAYFTPSDDTVATTKQPPAVVGTDSEEESDPETVPSQPQANGIAPLANPDEVLNKLNIGETINAAPEDNPLDNPDFDRLLDGDK